MIEELTNKCCCCDRTIPQERQSVFFQDQEGKWQAACLFCFTNVLNEDFITSADEPLQTAFLNYLASDYEACMECGEEECEGDFDEEDENIEFICTNCGAVRIQEIGWGDEDGQDDFNEA